MHVVTRKEMRKKFNSKFSLAAISEMERREALYTVENMHYPHQAKIAGRVYNGKGESFRNSDG
jgi:hypothetical protein